MTNRSLSEFFYCQCMSLLYQDSLLDNTVKVQKACKVNLLIKDNYIGYGCFLTLEFSKQYGHA